MKRKTDSKNYKYSDPKDRLKEIDDDHKENFPYMSVNQVKKYLNEAEEKKVSQVSRSPGGFIYNYLKSPEKMKNDPYWIQKRRNFIKRHLEQYKKDHGHRRKIALYMWAFDPKNY